MKIVKNSCKVALSTVLCAGMMLPTQALAEVGQDDDNYYISDNNVADNISIDNEAEGKNLEAVQDMQLSSPVDNSNNKPGGEPEKQNFSIDDVYFFINLGGDVLDTKQGSSHYLSDLFTGSVGFVEADGDSLQQKVKSNSGYYMFINNYYDAIVGANENDYANIDNQIRSTISVPSDASILANVKSQIENGAEVNDINGDKISSTLVSEKYFDVYWYVLKEGGDCWHVDGILKKKDPPQINTYTVNYNWTVPDGTPGLPNNIVLPSTVTYAENDNVKIDTTYEPGRVVDVEGGKYVFEGWDKQDFSITENTTVNGKWRWVPEEPVINEYNVTTHFKCSTNDETLAEDNVETYTEGSLWEYAEAPERIIVDDKIYVYDSTTGNEEAGTEIKGNQEVTHWYVLEEQPIENIYSLTQEYKILNTDTTIADSWVKDVPEFSAWEFIDAPQEIQYDGKTYTLKEVTGDKKIGDSILWNLAQTAWYVEKVEPTPTPEPEPTPITKYYTLTQEYKLYDKNVESAEDYVTLADPWMNKIAQYNPWKFIDPPTEIEKDGKTYVLEEITGDKKSGSSIKSDLNQTAWYVEKTSDEPVINPDEPKVEPDKPNVDPTPEEPSVEPSEPESSESDDVIDEEEVDNDNTLAKTGDNTPLVAALFAGLASIAALASRFAIKKNK